MPRRSKIVTSDTGRFTARDDLLHDLTDAGPRARESLLFTAPLPAEGLLVFAYMWRDADSRWGRFVFVAGENPSRPELLSFEEDVAMTAGDLDDCDVGGCGLRLRQPDPLTVAEVSFSGDGRRAAEALQAASA